MKSLGANETKAILLLSRKFSETSLICELFTRKNGRVSVIAKGARSKKNKFQNVAAPNILANINYSGKSELKTLTSWEEIKFQKLFQFFFNSFPRKLREKSIRILTITNVMELTTHLLHITTPLS